MKMETVSLDFNPLPPYGGRRGNSQTFGEWLEISIHSLRMEGDTNIWDIKACTGISIHSLRMEGDFLFVRIQRYLIISIHSLRMEGDNCSHRVTLQNVHFNPLPPYGGRPERRCLAMKRFKFQSTPSVWRETYNASEYDLMWGISIHSLRMEGDFVTLFYFHLCTSHFNPLPPHGGRHGLPF